MRDKEFEKERIAFSRIRRRALGYGGANHEDLCEITCYLIGREPTPELAS